MYYIAVVAPPAINKQVLLWKQFMRDQFGCIVALKSPAHITMISPFWMNIDLQPGLETFIHNFNRDKKSFPVQLKNFNSFKPRVIFVNVEHSASLLQLKTALENELTAEQKYPIKKESRPFHPHITIANRDLLKKDYYTAWEHFKNKQYDDNFLVTGLSLLKHNGTVWENVFTTNFPD